MSARTDNETLAARLNARGISVKVEDANILRRAEKTLHGWNERECGTSTDYASFSIERDETTGKPYQCVYPHAGESRRYPIADLETGALNRVVGTCALLGCEYYLQKDPRGAALYVAPKDAGIKDNTYSSVGICCAV